MAFTVRDPTRVAKKKPPVWQEFILIMACLRSLIQAVHVVGYIQMSLLFLAI